jgi:hypothetical protein
MYGTDRSGSTNGIPGTQDFRGVPKYKPDSLVAVNRSLRQSVAGGEN